MSLYIKSKNPACYHLDIGFVSVVEFELLCEKSKWKAEISKQYKYHLLQKGHLKQESHSCSIFKISTKVEWLKREQQLFEI